jgi:5-methylcytosine-specific restriction endonuclease McrA
MISLKVTYLEDDGVVSDSIMSSFVPYRESSCSALPEDGEYWKEMFYENIISAVEMSSGEIISVRELCGARPLARPINIPLKRQERPRGKRNEGQRQDSKELRRADTLMFKLRYGNDLIINHFRNELIDLFYGRCFACDNPNDLQMDHHIPLIKGGRKVPGNIVMLCYKCNAKKLDYMPEEFYSQEELAHLQPLLDKERELLDFEFDKERFNRNRYAYLLEIGISPLLLREVTTNIDHLWYVPLEGYGIGIEIRA